MEKLMSFRRSMEQLRPARNQKIDLLEKSQILLQEGNTQAAFDMEQVILSAAGGPFFKSKLIPNSKKVGDKIVTKLKLKGKGGKMPKNTYPASKEWSEYFKPGKPKGSTLTPKTDMIIGRFRVSLKTGPAVLMSGEKKEATATFYTAMNKTGTIDKAVKNFGIEYLIESLAIHAPTNKLIERKCNQKINRKFSSEKIA